MTDALASAAASEQGRDLPLRSGNMLRVSFCAVRDALRQDGGGTSELECSSAAPKRAANNAVFDNDDWDFFDVEDGRRQLDTHALPSNKAEASGSSDCGPWRELESFNNLCCAVKRARLANAGFTVFSLRLGRDSRSNPTSPCNTRASGVGA